MIPKPGKGLVPFGQAGAREVRSVSRTGSKSDAGSYHGRERRGPLTVFDNLGRVICEFVISTQSPKDLPCRNLSSQYSALADQAGRSAYRVQKSIVLKHFVPVDDESRHASTCEIIIQTR
jgi:hypothetical protein